MQRIIEGIRFMNKKIVIPVIVAIAIIIAAITYFSQPKNIIDDIKKYSIGIVVYNGVDVTERVDCKALASLVSKYQCSRLPHSFSPYQLTQVVVELYGINGNDPLYILLGDINVAYRSANNGGFSIRNSGALLNEILNIMPIQTEEELGLKDKTFITFSDGVSAEYWRPNDSSPDIYKLTDGTILLTIEDPTGPDNAYVDGIESYDDLSASAQKAVSAYYEEQGLLYDTRSELEKAYADYLGCKENGTEYQDRLISQTVAPTASNDRIICFLTSVMLPVNGQMSQELQLGAVFDRETGKVLSNWDLFILPEKEARQWLVDAFDFADPALRAEIANALKPEYIILFPDNMDVTFPMGTLPSQEYRYGTGIDYKKLRAVLQPWAIPNGRS